MPDALPPAAATNALQRRHELIALASRRARPGSGSADALLRDPLIRLGRLELGTNQ